MIESHCVMFGLTEELLESPEVDLEQGPNEGPQPVGCYLSSTVTLQNLENKQSA